MLLFQNEQLKNKDHYVTTLGRRIKNLEDNSVTIERVGQSSNIK